MPYVTGGGGNVNALVNAIRDFAVPLGWIVSGQGANTRGGFLFLEKDLTHLALEWITNVTYPMYTASGGAVVQTPDHLIRAWVGPSITTTKTGYFGHPLWLRSNGSEAGFPGGVSGQIPCAQAGGLTGPLAAWHIFSDEDSSYIHVAVNTTSDLWTHFSFGEVDKGDMAHSGATFVMGTHNYWARDSNTANPADTSLHYNKPALQKSVLGPHQLYVPDALPTAAGFGLIIPDNWSVTDAGTGPVTIRSVSMYNDPSTYLTNGASGRLLDHVIGASAPTWSGQTPLYGIPVLVQRTDAVQYCAIGMFPDMRIVNMTGMLPGQEINLSGTIWKVFPVMRQEPWSSSGTQYIPSTGQYGVAYKKIA